MWLAGIVVVGIAIGFLTRGLAAKDVRGDVL
jgi:hypothetical protein